MNDSRKKSFSDRRATTSRFRAYRILAICLFAITGSTSCRQQEPPVTDWESHIKDHKTWQQNRLERLKSETGWLNLAGLYWLSEGENTFGSGKMNDIVFPEGFAEKGGTLIVSDSSISYIDAQRDILVDSLPAVDGPVRHDQQENTTMFSYMHFRWYVIKRGDKFGIRLRDLEHPRISELDHIPSYSFSKKWVIEADFIPFDTVSSVEVPTVIEGYSEFYDVYGKLQFRANGAVRTLLPFGKPERLFLIFGDLTNGLETYGAGRFLSLGGVNDGKILIDFNRAYNPPCAFSPFATCPLPPLENFLDLEIKAGEQSVHLE